jgi:hypothetical protein
MHVRIQFREVANQTKMLRSYRTTGQLMPELAQYVRHRLITLLLLLCHALHLWIGTCTLPAAGLLMPGRAHLPCNPLSQASTMTAGSYTILIWNLHHKIKKIPDLKKTTRAWYGLITEWKFCCMTVENDSHIYLGVKCKTYNLCYLGWRFNIHFWWDVINQCSTL